MQRGRFKDDTSGGQPSQYQKDNNNLLPNRSSSPPFLSAIFVVLVGVVAFLELSRFCLLVLLLLLFRVYGWWLLLLLLLLQLDLALSLSQRN